MSSRQWRAFQIREVVGRWPRQQTIIKPDTGCRSFGEWRHAQRNRLDPPQPIPDRHHGRTTPHNLKAVQLLLARGLPPRGRFRRPLHSAAHPQPHVMTVCHGPMLQPYRHSSKPASSLGRAATEQSSPGATSSSSSITPLSRVPSFSSLNGLPEIDALKPLRGTARPM